MTLFSEKNSGLDIQEPYLKQEVLGRTNRLLSFDVTRTSENDAINNSSVVACVFVAG
jgi:hypothetical protein